jgi:hypothetical protein
MCRPRLLPLLDSAYHPRGGVFLCAGVGAFFLLRVVPSVQPMPPAAPAPQIQPPMIEPPPPLSNESTSGRAVERESDDSKPPTAEREIPDDAPEGDRSG